MVKLNGYSKTATMTAVGFLGENSLFVLQYAIGVLRVLVMLSIWRMVLAGRGEVSGMTLGSVLTYTLISETFGGLLSFRTAIADELWNGQIALRLLRPMHISGQYLAEALGGWSVSFCMWSVPLLLLSPLLGVNPLPHNIWRGLWFLLSLGLAVAVGLAIDLMFGAVVVMLGHGEYSVGKMRSAVTVLLSGSLLPLALLPWGIGEVFGWLPFASMASAPLRIYTGTGDPVRLVLVQAGWVLVLWPVALVLWRRQRERMVTYGG